MSGDADVRALERAASADRTVESLVRLWLEQFRQGARSVPPDLTIKKPGAEVASTFQDNEKWIVAYDGVSPDVPVVPVHLFWEGREHEDWTSDTRWCLLASEDGRFVAFTSGTTGTCSGCGNDVYVVSCYNDLLDAVMQGLPDRARDLMLYGRKT